MRLRVFHAADGDCLLLSSSDGRHALIDGGRSGTFQQHTWGTLQELAEADDKIDLVVVSHIDADHISGIISLMRAVSEWAVWDYQRTEGGNANFPEPRVPRPPEIKKVWHNAWRAQLGDVAEEVEALAATVGAIIGNEPVEASGRDGVEVRVLEALQLLAQSIPEGVELRRLIDEETPIPRNDPFDDLVMLQDPPHTEKLGGARLTVIGPGRRHIDSLRKEWRHWLSKLPVRDAGTGHAVPRGLTDIPAALSALRAEEEAFVSSITGEAKLIATSDPTGVTPPNRASITLLAEEKKRTCLLTGDAAEEEILEGLEAAGRITDGHMWCNVVKVQHHGSEHNLSQEFAGTVLADNYVFCANGAAGNPDPSVVKTVVDTRMAKDPRPFTVWFNCSVERTSPGRRADLARAIEVATSAAEKDGRITVEVLDDAKSFFDITV